MILQIYSINEQRIQHQEIKKNACKTLQNPHLYLDFSKFLKVFTSVIIKHLQTSPPPPKGDMLALHTHTGSTKTID